MNKIVLSLLLMAGLTTLTGCNNREELDMAANTQAAEFKPMQQSYLGELPCADCAGIETHLFLQKNGTWIMNMAYLGVKDAVPLGLYGTWARTADQLVLTDSQGGRHYFRPQGENLVMLDKEGKALNPELYTLKPANLPLPQTPMTMRGTYRYLADSALFTDCDTGRQMLVASDAALERGYLSARTQTEQAVLLVMEAHFVQQANPDTGAPVLAIQVNGQQVFMPDRACQDLPHPHPAR